MSIELNRYYTVKAGGPEAIRLTETLLQSFPVTRTCLGILGNRLIEKIGFGFFNAEKAVITQGEQGKDLFLLCDQSVDVFVDDQKVVQMEAPALLGDKGIVEPESKRAATIKAAPDTICFFLKIPMGLFIRNFDDMNITDASFSQEIGIFYNMFKGIQNRLFEFAFIQKNLWEEAITSQSLAKTQKLIKILDSRVDEGWGDSVWETVRTHLANSLKFNWPDGVPLDISTFRNLLKQHLDERYPREAFKGKDADYIRLKHQLWRNWLASVASAIVKEIPSDEEDLDENKIQLFNPRNYQLRIQGLIKAIEKKFLSSKTRTDAEEKGGANKSSDDSLKQFFGRTEKDNTFDLKSYLNSFEQKFQLKYPKRMQTQIAQRTAMVAAKCENEFNESVATIKQQIQKSQSQLSGSYLLKNAPPSEQASTDQILAPIFKAVNRYYQHLDERNLGKMGKVTYKHQVTPSLGLLIKRAGSKHVREELIRAVQAIIQQFNLSSRLLNAETIKKSFYVCEASPGFEIHQHDIEKHFWIPLTKGVRLFSGDQPFADINPGKVIGGKGWLQTASDDSDKELGQWNLVFEKKHYQEKVEHFHLILVIPNQVLPWEVNSKPVPKMFQTFHLPMMQWMINKELDHISSVLPIRDEVFEKMQKTEQVVHLESKLSEFENKAVKISKEAHFKIVDFINNVTELSLDKTKAFASNKLSKKLYNHILKQMAIDYPGIKPEELGNKTYTKWRLLLSEIIQITEQSEIESTAVTASPFFEIIENEIGWILDSFSIPKAREFVKLTGQTPYIQLPRIIAMLENPEGDRLLIYELIQSTLETYLRLAIEETRVLQRKYEQIKQNKPTADVQALQTETILDCAEKLRTIFAKQLPQPA